MITRSFVAKVTRSVTPVLVATSSIQAPLAEANTSAAPSDSIWVARSPDAPKSKVTVTPGSAASKSAPIFVKAFVSDDAAKTTSVRRPTGVGLEPPFEEQAVTTRPRLSSAATTRLIGPIPSTSRRRAAYQRAGQGMPGKAGVTSRED